MIGFSQIVLNCVWLSKLHLPWKNESSSFSDDQDMKHNEFDHYVCVWSGDPHYGNPACREPNYGVVARYHMISDWVIIVLPNQFC